MRKFIRVACLLLLVPAHVVFADQAALRWGAPTSNADGSPLNDLAGYNVYYAVDGGTFQVVQAVSDPAATSYVHQGIFDGQHCYQVTAVDLSGNESAPSNIACKVVDSVRPAAPSNLQIDTAVQASTYRGIPDPSAALGFDVFGDYTATETVTGAQSAVTYARLGTPEVPYVLDLSGATYSGRLTIEGEYIVVIGPTVNAPAGSGPWISMGGATNSVIRDATLVGPQIDSSHSSAVAMGSRTVWVGGEVAHFGDISPTAREQDFHGFKVMRDDVWILDLHSHHVSGDSVQVGDSSRGSASRVYIGGGDMHDNRENAVDVKDSFDVVVSGVRMHGFRPTDSSPGEALIFHDDAVGGKALDNIIYDTTIGIVSSGLRDHVIDGNSIDGINKDMELRNTQNITVQNNFNPLDRPLVIDQQGGLSGSIQAS